uniref:Uncharacterized protein n=1 Tax=Anopheles albimanus TaxID=7167 RepID=A0A182F980_ANOAL
TFLLLGTGVLVRRKASALERIVFVRERGPASDNMWRKSGTDRGGKMRERNAHLAASGGLERLRANSTDYTERIFHDEEFGEENVELVDEEWASFERVLREFRERRLLNASMENLPRQKKSRKKRTQAFYPMPMPSMSDTVDQDSSSTSSSDEAYETDEDGYIRTLVSRNRH